MASNPLYTANFNKLYNYTISYLSAFRLLPSYAEKTFRKLATDHVQPLKSAEHEPDQDRFSFHAVLTAISYI